MATLNDITSNLMDENKSEIIEDLYKKINNIEDNMDSDHGKFFIKELKNIVDSSDTKSQKGLGSLNSKLKDISKSISDSDIIMDSEKNTLNDAISGQQEIISDNSTLTSKVANFIKNKAEKVADNGFDIDASSITMAITGSPAFGLAAGFLQDKAKDRIKNIVLENKDRKNRLKRIKLSEDMSKKEFEFLRTQISEQQVKDKLNITDEEIQNKSAENNQTHEEYLNTLKDSIIQKSQSDKEQREIDSETKKEKDKIKEKYGMDNSNTTSNDNSNVTSNDNSNVTSNDNSNTTSNDNSNVTTNREPIVTTNSESNDNSEITSIYPTSNSSSDSSDSTIEESREINRTQEEQTNQLTEINENLRDVVSLLNDGNDVRSENKDEDGDGGIIDTVKDAAGSVLATLGIGGGLLASVISAYKGFKKGGIKGGIKNVRNLVSGKSSTSGGIIDPGIDMPDKSSKNNMGKKSSLSNKAKGMVNFGKRGASSVGRGAASIGSRILPAAARAATMVPGVMGSIGTAIASANPIGLAVLGTAALGAGSYALWDHMRGSDKSKKIMDTLDEQGIVDHDVIGNSTILNWDAIKLLKPEDLQSLIEYDDWEPETLKRLKMIADPKTKNAIDYKEGKERKKTAQQKLDTLEKTNINAEKVIRPNEVTDFMGLDGVEEFKDPELQKEKKKLENEIHRASRQIVKAKEAERNRIIGHTDRDNRSEGWNDITQTQKELEYLGLTKSSNKELNSKMDLLAENSLEKNAAKLNTRKKLQDPAQLNIKKKIPHNYVIQDDNGVDKTVTKEEYENRRSLLFSDSMERDADEINDQVKWLRKNKPPTSSSPNTRSWNLSPDEYKQMNTDILRQDALVTEQSKFNNTHGNKPKDNIINAPTNNVNNSKQNVTNIIDTSKNSFNSANKGLRGSY